MTERESIARINDRLCHTRYDIDTYMVDDPAGELDRRVAARIISFRLDPDWLEKFNKEYLVKFKGQSIWVAYSGYVEKIYIKSVDFLLWYSEERAATLITTRVLNEECLGIYSLANLHKVY